MLLTLISSFYFLLQKMWLLENLTFLFDSTALESQGEEIL